MSDIETIVETLADGDELQDVVEVLEIVRNDPRILVAVGLLGLAIGGTVGYFATKKYLKAQYEQIVTEEIADAKEFYGLLNKVDENGEAVSPQAIFEQKYGREAAAALREYQGAVVETPVATEAELADEQDEELLAKTEEKVKPFNAFADPSFDYEEELKYRTKDAPYIITHDEYFAAEEEYDQSSLTYYELDDVLVDEMDKPVDNPDSIVGEDHLVRFGAGSKDRNIIYVRNDKMGMDFEIIKSTGSYLEEVLGMPNEEPKSLKHSDQRDLRRALHFGDG